MPLPVLDSSIYFWTRRCSWGTFCLCVAPSWTWKSQPLFLFLDSSGSKSEVPQDSLAQGAVAFSASTGRILLKINIYKHIPYKCREFGCDRSKIKGILQEEQCTFSASVAKIHQTPHPTHICYKWRGFGFERSIIKHTLLEELLGCVSASTAEIFLKIHI